VKNHIKYKSTGTNINGGCVENTAISNLRNIMEDDSKLDELYGQFTEIVADRIKEGYDIVEICPIMIRIALELYKTTMTDEEYNAMVEFIYDYRDEINKIVPSNSAFH
jgi:DNA-directed RNA polymerase subunit F